MQAVCYSMPGQHCDPQLGRTLRCGQRLMPCLRQIFLSTVGQMSIMRAASLIGWTKYLAISRMSVQPFLWSDRCEKSCTEGWVMGTHLS